MVSAANKSAGALEKFIIRPAATLFIVSELSNPAEEDDILDAPLEMPVTTSRNSLEPDLTEIEIDKTRQDRQG